MNKIYAAFRIVDRCLLSASVFCLSKEQEGNRMQDLVPLGDKKYLCITVYFGDWNHDVHRSKPNLNVKVMDKDTRSITFIFN